MTFWSRLLKNGNGPVKFVPLPGTIYSPENPQGHMAAAGGVPETCQRGSLCKTMTRILSSEQRISEAELIFNRISTGVFYSETK